MKTAAEHETELGILDACITVSAEINEKDEEQYNQLVIDISQRVDSAFQQQIRIPYVTRSQILRLAKNIEKLAKYFPIK